MPLQAYRNHPWLVSPIRTKAGEIRLAGSLQNAPALDPRSMRVLGSYSLIYMIDVDGYYRDASGRDQRIAAGDAVLIFPELAHAYGPNGGRDWTQIYVVFNGPQFDFWRQCGILSPERPTLHVEPVDYWRRRLEDVFATETPRSEAAALRSMGRFLQVLTEMLAADAEAHRAPRDVWLENSIHLLGERSEKGWLTPQQVARKIGLSYDNFRKQFAARTGLPPGQYQKRQRIDRACAAIYQGSHGFKELAEELAFCDVFHFSKAFKQVVGQTPSEFRRKVRGH
jgi:AraC-like DNA-binding protein